MKCLSTLAVILLSLTTFAHAGGVTLTTTSAKVSPKREITSAQPWVSGMALVQGQVIKNNGFYYMAEVAIGSSVTAPDHASGVVNNLREFDRKARHALVLQHVGTAGVIWIHADKTAVVDECIKLEAGQAITFTDFQNAFYAVASVNGLILTYTEID